MYTQRVGHTFCYFGVSKSKHHIINGRLNDKHGNGNAIRNKFGMFGSIVSDLSGFQHFPFWATFIKPVNPESCAQQECSDGYKILHSICYSVLRCGCLLFNVSFCLRCVCVRCVDFRSKVLSDKLFMTYEHNGMHDSAHSNIPANL